MASTVNEHEYELLGKGSFGTVWGRGNKALKVIQFVGKTPDCADAIREVHICTQMQKHQENYELGSNFVVQFLASSQTYIDGVYTIAIEMARAQGGSLFDRLRESSMCITPDVISTIMIQMKQAVLFCHFTCNIVIRDISPNNILIVAETPLHFAMSDFGKARPIPGRDENLPYSQGYHGAPLYQPPRAFSTHDERCSKGWNADWKNADWFSLAAVVVCACNPGMYWASAPRHSNDVQMKPAYAEFSQHQIPGLLTANSPLMDPKDVQCLSKWISREIDLFTT